MLQGRDRIVEERELARPKNLRMAREVCSISEVPERGIPMMQIGQIGRVAKAITLAQAFASKI